MNEPRLKTGQPTSYLLEELIFTLVHRDTSKYCQVFWIEWRDWKPQGFAAMWIRSSESCLSSGITWFLISLVSGYLPGFSYIMKVAGVGHCRLYHNFDFWSPAIYNPLFFEVSITGTFFGLDLFVPQSWFRVTSFPHWFPVYTCPVTLDSFGKLKFWEMSIQAISY